METVARDASKLRATSIAVRSGRRDSGKIIRGDYYFGKHRARMSAMLSIQRRKRVEFVSDRFAGYVGRRPLEDVRSNEWISAVHPDDRE